MSVEEFVASFENMLYGIQSLLLEKNKSFRETNTYYVDTYDEFKDKIEK